MITKTIGQTSLKQVHPERIYLDDIPSVFHEQAIDAFLKNDFDTFYGLASSDDAWCLYINNMRNLSKGYNREKAFLAMWTNQKRGLGAMVTAKYVHRLLNCHCKLEMGRAGDQIPKGESFTLFRGAHGLAPDAKLGISWTDNLSIASWFAVEHNAIYQDNVPTIYTTQVQREEVWAYIHESGREESEFLIIPKRPVRMKLSIEEMEKLSKAR